MVTRQTLQSLRTELKELDSVIAAALAPLNTHEALFDSQSDYYESLRNQNKVPQDYYKFRFFDFELYIYYDLRKKTYSVRSSKYDSVECGSDFHFAKRRFLELLKEYSEGFYNELVSQLDLF